MKIIYLFPILTCVLFLLILSPSLLAEKLHPPWKKPPEGGVKFTVDGIVNVPDLHGEIVNPDLIIFFGGNQFMVLPDIMAAFRKEYPQYKKIYYETLPPGIIEKQIKTKSLVIGNLEITHNPDMFVAGEQRLRRLDKQEDYFDTIRPYFRNRLAIMIHEGNSKGIESLKDLGDEKVAVSMPNPETEGIAQKAIKSFEKAWGEELVEKIMKTKVENGTTFITQIHHRQTPMRIMVKKSDAGPVWITEALFQKQIGNPIDMVEIPDDHNITSTTAAGIFRDAPHPKAARDILSFLIGDKAAAIYNEYGFMPIKEKL
jgi:molybdate transport system substrate-binding protein